MFGIGLPELVIILVIALIFVGPGKLPEVGKAIGKGIRNFRKATEEPDEDEIKQSLASAQPAPPPQQQQVSVASPYPQEDNSSKEEKSGQE